MRERGRGTAYALFCLEDGQHVMCPMIGHGANLHCARLGATIKRSCRVACHPAPNHPSCKRISLPSWTKQVLPPPPAAAAASRKHAGLKKQLRRAPYSLPHARVPFWLTARPAAGGSLQIPPPAHTTPARRVPHVPAASAGGPCPAAPWPACRWPCAGPVGWSGRG